MPATFRRMSSSATTDPILGDEYRFVRNANNHNHNDNDNGPDDLSWKASLRQLSDRFNTVLLRTRTGSPMMNIAWTEEGPAAPPAALLRDDDAPPEPVYLLNFDDHLEVHCDKFREGLDSPRCSLHRQQPLCEETDVLHPVARTTRVSLTMWGLPTTGNRYGTDWRCTANHWTTTRVSWRWRGSGCELSESNNNNNNNNKINHCSTYEKIWLPVWRRYILIPIYHHQHHHHHHYWSSMYCPTIVSRLTLYSYDNIQ